MIYQQPGVRTELQSMSEPQFKWMTELVFEHYGVQSKSLLAKHGNTQIIYCGLYKGRK